MDEHSRTAVLAAVAREMHAETSTDPVLDDEFASELVTPDEKTQITEVAKQTGLSDTEAQQLGESYSIPEAWKVAFRGGAFAAASVVRNRYAEDCLESAHRERDIDQYVLVGAGLETFPWRRSELATELTIIELDHPATQRFKRDRLADADLKPPDSVHFAPVDLETERVSSALDKTLYDPERPAFYSWLGVTPYLSVEAILGTLQDIAAVSAPGTEVVFDFVDREGSTMETTTERIQRFMHMVESMGASAGDGLELETFEETMDDLGFQVLEVLDPDDQQERYFDDQPEHFEPTEHYHFAHVKLGERIEEGPAR